MRMRKLDSLFFANHSSPHQTSTERVWTLNYTPAPLIAARKTSAPQSTIYPNPNTPTFTLAQAILHASPLLTELVIVREWSHGTVAQPLTPEATAGYWSFTKHMMVQIQRMSTAPTAGVVDALNQETTRSVGHLASSDCVVRIRPY